MYQRQVRFRFGGPLTPAVKNLLLINIVIFVIQNVTNYELISQWFALSHNGLLTLKIWQIFTYMFLHGKMFYGGFTHIFFNMFALWMFGGDLERLWGSKFFLRYYLLCGLGAGIFIAMMNAYMAEANPLMADTPTLGASGAIYGILLAYGMTWPNREVLIYFLFPVKMKYVVLFFGLIEFFGTLSSVQGAGGHISHIGHLGGIVTGFFVLWYKKQHPGPRNSSSRSTETHQGFVESFVKKRRVDRKRSEIEKRIKAKKIIDRLLEKIAREGMSALSKSELKDLEWARKHYYPDSNDTLH
jgi:membrane associated rhomboid family serine protease